MSRVGSERRSTIHTLLPLGGALIAGTLVVVGIGGRELPSKSVPVQAGLVSLEAASSAPPTGPTAPTGRGLAQLSVLKLPTTMQPLGSVGGSAVAGAHVYYLADQANNGVDVFSLTSGTYLGTLDHGGFAGPSPAETSAQTTACGVQAGPTGVLPVTVGASQQLFVGGGVSATAPASRVKVLVLGSPGTATVGASVSTGGTCGTSGLAYDSKDKLVAVVNGQDTTPFLSLLSVRPQPSLDRVVAKVRLPQAIGGLGGVVWDAQTDRFLVGVVQEASTQGAWAGAVAVVDPRPARLLRLISAPGCSVAGLALDPSPQLLAVGCSRAAMVGDAVSGVQVPPGAGRTLFIAVRTGVLRGRTYSVGGTSDVAYSPRLGLFLTASDEMTSNSWNSGYPAPSLGVIVAGSAHFVEDVPTALGASTVAADPTSTKVMVPIPRYGIAVLGPTS